MALTKTLNIDGVEATFKASAAVPRMYRMKFGRDIYRDLANLEKSVNEADGNGGIDTFSLEIFEDLAYIMAKHADPEGVPDSPNDWLEQFNTFSIYQVLPELIDLWGLNTSTTETDSSKNSGEAAGK